MIRRDTLWKALIEELAEDFLYFFFPTYMDQIDLRRGVVFLDKDLERIMPEADTRRRHADKLFKVWLNDGEEHWFLVHVNSVCRGLGVMHKPDARVYADTE